ncbi:SPFH domain-containing protein [Amycolatopsis panacis]|uniref:SPFH domain-containing protein n=1 Tax=Amycolatopsis panacis TaxID=2340917 RepID=UPI001EFF2418|nr:SPFH domain-containing protein [Amycolatopsis panacis]
MQSLLATTVRIVKQYERGVLFRPGRVAGAREPRLRLIVPVVDVVRRIPLRVIMMPIQSQVLISRGNMRIDASGVADFRVREAVKSAVSIENVHAAIDRIAQTTLRKVGINTDIRGIPDLATLQPRNAQSLVELGVDKNITVVFPALSMSTICDPGAFPSRENAAADRPPASVAVSPTGSPASG